MLNLIPSPISKSTAVDDPDKHKYGFFMVLVIAIGIPVAGVLGGWNQGAADGLWCTFVGTLLVGVLYICLMACYGELVATVPFSGGAFGYCRCALGPFWGFIVGASEVLQYFTFVASSVQFGSTAVTFALGASPDLEPIYYLIIYLVTFFVQLRGGNLLWNVVIVCSVVTIFPVILFLIGAFMKFDYNKYANAAPNMYESFPSGDGFMRSAFLGPSYFYIGIEMLPQVCNHVRDPNITLPRGTTPGYGVDLSAVSYPMDHILWEVGSTHASTSRNNSNHASASAGAGATTTKSKLESFNKKVAPAPATTSTASATAGTDGTRPPAEVILVTSAPHGTAANVTRIAPLPSTEGTDGHEEADDEGDGNALTFVENDTVLAPPVDAGTPMSTRGSGSHAGGNSARKSALRTSWNVKQQNVFGMSNKSLSTKDSQKFMEIILCHGDQPPEKLLSTLATEWPDQFVVESPSEPV
eukprot:gene900-649_t